MIQLNRGVFKIEISKYELGLIEPNIDSLKKLA